MASFIRRKFLVGAVIFIMLPTSRSLAQLETRMNSTEGTQRRWMSRIISDHIWDFRVITDTNPKCTRHYAVYRQHLDNFTSWAMQMFDASDLVPNGFLIGDTYNLGNFDECLKTKVPSELGFSPQYCLPVISFVPANFSSKASGIEDEWTGPVWNRIVINDRNKAPRDRFSLAFCIPSSCSHADLRTSLQSFLESPMRQEGYSFKVDLNNLQCTTAESPAQSYGGLVFIYFMIGMTFVVLICTLGDILLAVIKGEKHSILKFSLTGVTGKSGPFLEKGSTGDSHSKQSEKRDVKRPRRVKRRHGLPSSESSRTQLTPLEVSETRSHNYSGKFGNGQKVAAGGKQIVMAHAAMS